MKMMSNTPGRSEQRTPEEWRGTGIALLGIGLIVCGLMGWLIWGLAPIFFPLDLNSAELLAIFLGIMLLGAVELCEGTWRIVCGRPSIWGTRALVLVLLTFVVGLFVLAIIEGINPFELED